MMDSLCTFQTVGYLTKSMSMRGVICFIDGMNVGKWVKRKWRICRSLGVEAGVGPALSARNIANRLQTYPVLRLTTHLGTFDNACPRKPDNCPRTCTARRYLGPNMPCSAPVLGGIQPTMCHGLGHGWRGGQCERNMLRHMKDNVCALPLDILDLLKGSIILCTSRRGSGLNIKRLHEVLGSV